MLIQAAADRQNGRVNLTAVGRTVCRDFGWNNDRWRRFVRRLQKENFIAVVEKKNLGDKVGHIHIALVLFSTWSNQELVVAPFDAVRVHTGVPHEEMAMSTRSEEGSNAAAVVVAAEALVEQNEEEPVWLVIADDES